MAWLTDWFSEWLQDSLVNHFDWFVKKKQFTRIIHSHIELHWLFYILFDSLYNKKWNRFWVRFLISNSAYKLQLSLALVLFVFAVSALYLPLVMCGPVCVHTHFSHRSVQLSPNLQLSSFQPFSFSSKVMFKNACFPLTHTTPVILRPFHAQSTSKAARPPS